MTSSSGKGHPELEVQSSPRGFEHRHLPAEAILGEKIPIYQGRRRCNPYNIGGGDGTMFEPALDRLTRGKGREGLDLGWIGRVDPSIARRRPK